MSIKDKNRVYVKLYTEEIHKRNFHESSVILIATIIINLKLYDNAMILFYFLSRPVHPYRIISISHV